MIATIIRGGIRVSDYVELGVLLAIFVAMIVCLIIQNGRHP